MTVKINIQPPDKISGFTICRDSKRLGYPFAESIRSLAAVCDEIVIALDDTHDGTWQMLIDLRTELKCEVNIFDSPWNMANMKGGLELSRQTNIALEKCKYDMVFYLQSDEVIHEKDYDRIRADFRRLHKNNQAASLLFNWVHFYGDPHTIVKSRKWYRREIRAFKKSSGLKSYLDAQSFRKPVGDAFEKLPTLASDVEILHYGHVKPSALMAEKVNYLKQQWQDKDQTMSTAENVFKPQYGIQKFKGTHPRVMQNYLVSLPETNPHAYELLAPKGLNPKHFRYWVSDIVERATGNRIGEFKSYSKIL